MKKNIAIIITKLNGGGAERCASNLSVELSKIYNVFLIVFDASDITYPYSGKLIDLKVPKSDGGLKRYIGVLKRTRMIHRIKKENNIDVSISLLEGPNLVNVLSRWKEKVIVSVRNCMTKQNGSKIANAIIKYASKKADVTVSLSEMVKIDLVDNYGIEANKIVTIYNHVDQDLLKSQKNESNFVLDKRRKYIVNMGRLHHQKGQWHLIRAFSKIAEQCPDLDLLILGEGELKQRLLQLAKELGVEKRVLMPGYIKSPHCYFNDCEMFVFSSLYEGLGNVLLEAEAFNLPIISTDCIAGPREILAPDTEVRKSAKEMEFAKFGILIPVDDQDFLPSDVPCTKEETLLAEAILNLHSDKNMQEKYRKASQEGAKRFKKDKIINDWIQVIG